MASTEAGCTFFCGGDQSEYYTIGSGDQNYFMTLINQNNILVIIIHTSVISFELIP